ncbi:hypothetical protein ABPG75_002333 [Micractinium tetrahymenae]
MQAALLLAASSDDGSTALHTLCRGEPLGPLGGCLLWALRAPAGGVWPSRHQRARQELLGQLLQRNPRLLLHAGSRDAAGATPLHRAVLSSSLGPLALLLAALHQLPQPAGGAATGTASAMQLLLSVPNAEGLSAFELAVSRQQWAAARLLAAAAHGEPPLSQAQLEACELVQRCLAAAGAGGRFVRSASSAGAAGGVQLSASGATVTEALGGLLSKLWDTFDSSAAAAESEEHGRISDSRPVLLQGDRGTETGDRGSAAELRALLQEVLQPEALNQEGVLALAAIDEGDPRRAACPQPGCSVPLPSDAAPRLLPAASLRRFQQLQAQRYVTAHPVGMRCCPRPGCGATLRLPEDLAAALAAPQSVPVAGAGSSRAGALPAAVAGPSSAAAATAAAAAEQDEAGLDADCAACGSTFCWRCGEDAHEPASCSQVRRWSEELATLRRAAPDADRQWLARNSKRCPQCKAHIQKLGGCNHMRCSGCGAHFCWVCGRPWSEHSVETGGYYHCSLEQRDDLPEYGAAAGGGGGVLGGPLAWVAGVWGSIKAAAQQQQLQGHLREYLRHSGGQGGLFAAAAHMHLLLGAAGLLATSGAGAQGGSGGSGSGGGGGGMGLLQSGPELLGLGPQEARRMGRDEWSELVAAAAASAALSVDLPAGLAAAAIRPAAEAALQAACSSAGERRGGIGAGSSAEAGSSAAAPGSGCTAGEEVGAYLPRLARSLADAHRLLQHAAVSLYLLPSGPARRQLQALAAPIRQRVDHLEPLLLALPEREDLPPPAPEVPLQRPGRPGSTQTEQHAPQLPAQKRQQHGRSQSSGGGGFLGWLLERLYGIETSPAGAGSSNVLPADQAARLARVDGAALLQQAQFAAAVHQQRRAVAAALTALEADCRALRQAGRARG